MASSHTGRLRPDATQLAHMVGQKQRLLILKSQISSIPALKSQDGEWFTDSKAKAQLIADTFSKKYQMPEEECNEYTPLHVLGDEHAFAVKDLTGEDAFEVLESLSADSATGPDLLPARILKRCARTLAKPLLILCRRILHEGRWPEKWLEDWIEPIYKKKEVFLAGNYRGVHLTPQLSKAAERLLGRLWVEEALLDIRVGNNQFAYREARGSKDVLAFAVLTWLAGFQSKQKIGIYLSDVSGAFDRVRVARLVHKLQAKRFPEKVIKVIGSWLRQRNACVVVGGQHSNRMELHNQVFQGTCWGPVLWDLFYEDCDIAFHEADLTEIYFADDANAWKAYDAQADTNAVLGDMKE